MRAADDAETRCKDSSLRVSDEGHKFWFRDLSFQIFDLNFLTRDSKRVRPAGVKARICYLFACFAYNMSAEISAGLASKPP